MISFFTTLITIRVIQTLFSNCNACKQAALIGVLTYKLLGVDLDEYRDLNYHIFPPFLGVLRGLSHEVEEIGMGCWWNRWIKDN